MCKKGEIAACILYFTNGAAMLLGLVGLALGIWILVADTAVTNSVPDYMAVTLVITTVVVCFIAGLGVFATVAQMKENADTDPNTGKGLGQEGCCTKDCCNSCGISLYCFFSIIGSFLALAMGIVAIHYSGELPNEITSVYGNSTATTTVQSWFVQLDDYIDNQISTMIVDSAGGDWYATQNLLGCCGWNTTVADAVFLTGDCCTNSDGSNATVVDSLTGDTLTQLFAGDITVTLGECSALSDGSTLTCKGVMLYQTQANLLTVGIVLVVIWFLLLVCFICALKVRYCSGGQVAPGSSAGTSQVDKSKAPKVDLNNNKSSSSSSSSSSGIV